MDKEPYRVFLESNFFFLGGVKEHTPHTASDKTELHIYPLLLLPLTVFFFFVLLNGNASVFLCL